MMAAAGVFDLELHDRKSPENGESDDEFHVADEFQVKTQFPSLFTTLLKCFSLDS